MKLSRRWKSWCLIFLIGLIVRSSPFVLAAASDVTDINTLTKEIEARKAQVNDLAGRMDAYRKKVNSYADTSASLEGDLDLIDNQLALTNLDVESTQKQIESQQFLLQISTQKISDATTLLEKQRSMMKETVFSLNTRDHQVGFLSAVFGSDTFDSMFAEVERFERLNEDLHQTLLDTQTTKKNLETTKEEQLKELADLQDMQSSLSSKQALLEEQKTAKTQLLTQTNASESQYRVLISEARAQEQYLSSQIVSLQKQVTNSIDQSDSYGDSSVITWPVEDPIITARFHDPNYPFRGVMPHSGLDMAVPVGTRVGAAAPGYVAVAAMGETGYGNRVMIIHTNGLATLYGHLSRITVKEGQYVSRGDQIGLSGGMPGMQGAGLSTGPHLHFEVRLNGIPVDPENYLVAR